MKNLALSILLANAVVLAASMSYGTHMESGDLNGLEWTGDLPVPRGDVELQLLRTQLKQAKSEAAYLRSQMAGCDCDIRCPEGFEHRENLNGCYKFVVPGREANVSDWWGAVKTCHQLHPLSHPVTLDSTEKSLEVMISMWRGNSDPAIANTNAFWIGGFKMPKREEEQRAHFVWESTNAPIRHRLVNRLCGSLNSCHDHSLPQFLMMSKKPLSSGTGVGWRKSCGTDAHRLTPLCEIRLG